VFNDDLNDFKEEEIKLCNPLVFVCRDFMYDFVVSVRFLLLSQITSGFSLLLSPDITGFHLLFPV